MITGGATSDELSLAPGETKLIFNNETSLSHDLTTQYDLTLKPLTSTTYKMARVAGTSPNFRTPRAIGSDATTEVGVSVNGPTAIFTAIGGTLFDLVAGGVAVGDYVRIGSIFSTSNQGVFQILSFDTNSFTIANSSAVTENSVVLGLSFASQLSIYSASGVQIGDTLKILGGFSPISRKSFKITDVGPDFIEFYSTSVLPGETGVLTTAFSIYDSAKQLVYIESDKKCDITVNGISGNEIEPFIINNSIKPGIFLRKSTMWSLSITNPGTEIAALYVATIEE
jgi:hypothetical protein